MSNNRTRAANPRNHSLRFNESVWPEDWSKTGRAKERIPNVRTSVMATAAPQSHHSRPSTWRMWRAELFVLLPDGVLLLTAVATYSVFGNQGRGIMKL